jgi:hypothetical protein
VLWQAGAGSAFFLQHPFFFMAAIICFMSILCTNGTLERNNIKAGMTNRNFTAQK